MFQDYRKGLRIIYFNCLEKETQIFDMIERKMWNFRAEFNTQVVINSILIYHTHTHSKYQQKKSKENIT